MEVTTMRAKRSSLLLLAAGTCTGIGLWLAVPVGPDKAMAHKRPHTQEQLKSFEQIFMQQVETGDLLFHGDKATQDRLRVKLSNTGMACAMCHP